MQHEPEAASAHTERSFRALQRAGFFVHHTSGSHYILKHPDRPILRVTVASHNRDLKRRTLEPIVEQSGLSVEEFLKFLSRHAMLVSPEFFEAQLPFMRDA